VGSGKHGETVLGFHGMDGCFLRRRGVRLFPDWHFDIQGAGTMWRYLRLFLAAFRLSILFLWDDQPIVKWFRDEWCIGRPAWRKLLSCHRCIGVWTAAGVLFLDKFKGTRWIVDVFALAGAKMVAMWLIKGVDKDIR